MLEALEQRLLRDANFHPKTGSVDVEGKKHPDVIIVESPVVAEGPDIAVIENGVKSFFNPLKVKAIHVNGGDGADTIDASTMSIQFTLDGGAGDASLTGSDSGDKLVGGGGSNTLNGNGGNDLLVAGLQADSISGGDGNDRIIPDNTPTADDTISGGKGFDVVDYSASKIKVVALVGGAPKSNQANDVIQSDVEQIRGSAFDDAITDSTKHPLQMF